MYVVGLDADTFLVSYYIVIYNQKFDYMLETLFMVKVHLNLSLFGKIFNFFVKNVKRRGILNILKYNKQ